MGPRASVLETGISKGQLVPLLFMQDAVAASQANAQLPIVETGATSGSTSIDGLVMPWDGEIVAVSTDLSAAATAGSLTVGPTVDGTEKTDLQQSITTETEKTSTVPRGTVPFAAGERIGVEITTDASWDGTSSDLAVVVWMILTLEGI